MAAVRANTPLSRASVAQFSSITVPGGLRHLHSGPVSMRMPDSPGATIRRAGSPPPRPPLHSQHLPFTHGGNFWRDNYLLERWHKSEQPVVYLGQTFHGYVLRRRLGDWCWLTKAASGAHMTIKFLNRSNHSELRMAQFVRDHSRSPYLCIIHDSFQIPHHLAHRDPRYAGVKFDAIVYPTTGTDLRRLSTPGEHIEAPDVPLSPTRRKRCARDVVRGLAELHSLGIVHGDIHPGNVALAPPSSDEIEGRLKKPPLEHEVCRKDGRPTDRTLPTRVTEPVDLGFGGGDTKILDLGFAFRPSDGRQYGRASFPSGTLLPPELLQKDATTSLPFKVDSWHLGLCIFFILTDGVPFMQTAFGCECPLDHYEEQIASLKDLKCDKMNEIPTELRNGFQPILLALLQRDPALRASVQELLDNDWLMREEDN